MSRKATPVLAANPAERRRPVRVKTHRITAEWSRVYPPDGERNMWWDRLKRR